MAFTPALPVVIVGGGVSGMTVAVEAAESGAQVLLIEKEPVLGGRLTGLHQYFPKLTTAESGIGMHLRRILSSSRITVLAGTEALHLSGTKGDFTLDLLQKPVYVNTDCTMCHKCISVCPVETNDGRRDLVKQKAIHVVGGVVNTLHYVIDDKLCQGEKCGRCVEVCEPKAIDLSAQPRRMSVKASTVVMATGWEPFDANRLDHLGFGRLPNVISSVMMEQMASPNGPTGGKILRPSDGREALRVAFVQCAGSRDENYLPYCSSICCLVSFKQAHYVRQASPAADVNIIYTDITNPCPGRYDSFIARVIDDEKVSYTKGKVTGIREDSESGALLLDIHDPTAALLKERTEMADLAVLATGMVPSILGGLLKEVMVLDQHGFMDPEKQQPGVYVTGVAKNPADVTTSMLDAAHTALRTIQGIRQ